MSGPKVVRIVTREEVLAICHGHLARVDAALEEWIRICRRNDCIDDEAVAEARGRRTALAELIAADRLMDLQKQAPAEEAFLRSDCQRRLAEAVSAQALARSKATREREAAAALLKALGDAAIPMPPELERGLARGDPSATSQALILLGAKASPKGDATLAANLREDAPTSSFGDWVRQQPPAAADPAMERIEARIAAILQISDAPQAADWRQRMAEAATAPTARRNLMVDTLEVETGRALTIARRRSEALYELRAVLAEGDAAGVPRMEPAPDPASMEVEAIAALAQEVSAAIEAHRSEEAVQVRRAAVLEGLSGLGYEVAEGMTTAWASDGRLVLRSASRPDYGVELSGGDRFQMRPVAFDGGDGGADVSRDRDAETIWCGDVGSLQQRLAEIGDGLVIEKSLPIGAVPLKRIGISAPERRDEVAKLKERTLR